MTDLVERLREWADLPSHVALLDRTEAIFDQGNRHKAGKKPADYLTSWLSMLRPFAFATKDDSWGEMEKLLCIVMRNYIDVRRDAGLAAAEIARLKTRLEVVDGWSEDCDGIACRDDTIRLQDERIARLTAEVEQASLALKDAISGIQGGRLNERMCCDGQMCGCMGSTNADFLLHILGEALAAKDQPHG